MFTRACSEVQKLRLWWGPFIQSRTCISLKFTGEFCVITLKNMTQNLKRNWLVSSKLTWGIWQILTRALENLKNLHFNGLLLNKVYNVWAKKSIEELCLMALNTDTTFEGKLTCAFKNDMRNYSKFSPEHVWKSKNWNFDGILLSKVENVWA